MWQRRLDLALCAVLVAIALQIVPLPASIAYGLSPGLRTFDAEARLLQVAPSFRPLSLRPPATMHAWVVAFSIVMAFWTARAVFARGGIRTVVTGLAWAAVVLVLVAVAQAAADTTLVYGVWRPIDVGARPLGPFINRNHFGTWSLLVFFLCFGCLQWRRTMAPAGRNGNWRVRVTRALDGRQMILVLAQLLLAINMAVSASRSTMLALACGAGYVAGAAPRRAGPRHGALWPAALAMAAVLAMIAYADVDRLLSRLDETRELGLSNRVAVWRDTARLIKEYPATGVGAGCFETAMSLYQVFDRRYYWNEAHSQYLQTASEGGALVVVPTAAALGALCAIAVRRLRRGDDPLHWMRLGASAALVAVAIQGVFETGLSLPANGMLAAVAAALLVHTRPGAAPAPASGDEPGTDDAARH